MCSKNAGFTIVGEYEFRLIEPLARRQGVKSLEFG